MQGGSVIEDFGVRDNVDYEQAHSFASCVTLGKLINLSVPLFPLV